MKEFWKEVSRRLEQLIRTRWTGQVIVEINLFEGGIGSVYFTNREKVQVKGS